MSINNSGSRSYEFGPFRLIPEENLLLRDGQPVIVPPKVFETLLCLVENEGHLMKKDDLLDRLWPNSFVEESTLARTVSSLRKVLAETETDKFVETVPKHGYRFVAPVRGLDHDPMSPAAVQKGASTQHIDGNGAVRSEATIVHERPAGENRWFRRLLSRPVVLVALLMVAAVITALVIASNRQTGPARDVTSIAVLPFTQIGEGDRDDMLEFGMADTLITRLSAAEASDRSTGQLGFKVRRTKAGRSYDRPRAKGRRRA